MPSLLLSILLSTAATIAQLQAEIELLQVRSKVNFLSLCVVICVMMIFFMWGMKEHHRKHVMMLERKNHALQRANKQAAEARNYAEHVSDMKTIYTKNLAHEIRTPLNIMYGFVQVLNDPNMQLGDKERQEVIVALHEGCEQLTKVVENIDIVAAKLDQLDSLSKVESVLKMDVNDTPTLAAETPTPAAEMLTKPSETPTPSSIDPALLV